MHVCIFVYMHVCMYTCVCTCRFIVVTFVLGFDFDDTPIVVMIMPGDTNATVPIPIINDAVVEGPERFNAVLLTDGMDGFVIGTPGLSEVTIIDDADSEC